MASDIVLPTPLYTEKNGLFVNIEGRLQEAKKCHNTIGQAKEEWSILKQLSNLSRYKFIPESFDELRSEMFSDFSNLPSLNSIIDVNPNTSIPNAGTSFESCVFNYPINNFYMSDVVSKNSITMSKCVSEILSKPLLEKSA